MDFFENDTVENNLKIPYDIEAEEALLGSIFVRPDIISDVLEKIGVDDFYKNNHKIIFSEMIKVYNKGKIIDMGKQNYQQLHIGNHAATELNN